MPHVLQLSSLANHKSFFSFRCKFDLCESEKQKSVTIRGEKKGGKKGDFCFKMHLSSIGN